MILGLLRSIRIQLSLKKNTFLLAVVFEKHIPES